MKKLGWILISLLAVSAPALAAELGFEEPTAAKTAAVASNPKRDQIAAALRERLTPSIEAILQEQCGEDCPSFRVDPQFKKAAAAASTIDDLGFSKPLPPEAAPELSSVAVSVLIQDRVSQKARESLRKIVAAKVSNEANVPASVRVLPLDAFAPLMEKRLHPEAATLALQEKINLVKASAWPVSALLLALLAITALVLVLRHRTSMERERVAAKERARELKSAAQTQQAQNEAVTELEEEILPTRADDLRWLIEDAALRADSAAIAKILGVFPAHELSKTMRLSEAALAVLATLPTQATVGKSADAAWLRAELDRAHWGRLEEQANRLARLRRIPTSRLAQIFSRLSSMGTRAAFVASLPEDRWPKLLATLSSDERVELGLRLADYAAATQDDRAVLVAQLGQELGRLDDMLATRSEAALESFSLYLSENEGQKLWQEISVKSLSKRTRAPLSVDALLAELDPSAAVEVCSRLDVGTLSVVLTQVSGETRAKIYQHLPKSLQARVGNQATGKTPAEPEIIRARAALMGMYRQFNPQELPQ